MTRLTTLFTALLLVGCNTDSPGWYAHPDDDSGVDGGDDASVDTDTESTSDSETEDTDSETTDTDSETTDTESSTEDTDSETTTEDTDSETTTEDTDTGDSDTVDTDTVAYCPEGLGAIDEATGLCWQINYKAGVDKAGAESYCDALVLGGFDGWRLPSRDEYVGILDGCSAAVLSGDTGYCYTCATSTTCHDLLGDYGDVGCFWTSTYVSPGTGWGVCLADGLVGVGGDTDATGYARCVRGG
jgi:hypothetical protein